MITVEELHALFDFEIDKEHSQDAPSFHPLTKDKFINKAIDEFVKTRYAKVDVTEKNRQDTEPFIINTTLPVVTSVDNVYKVQLPDNHYYTLKIIAMTEKSGCEIESRIKVKPEKHDNIFAVLDNPFKKPNANKCVYTINDSKLMEVYVAPLTIFTSFKVYYIKRPTVVNIMTNTGSEINQQTKHDVIAIAVKYALEYIGSPRLSSYIQTNQHLFL